MSHGGMGGGGGHGGHHGGHHGGVAAGHHADQSASWNMAMQIEKDLGRRPGFLDPRIIVGLTLFVFVTLVSLPYTLDYFQNIKLAGKKGAVVDQGPSPDSSGPSAASLSMVGATLFGSGVHLPENFGGSNSAHESAVIQAKDDAVRDERADNTSEDEETSSAAVSDNDQPNEHEHASSASIMNPADTPAIVNQSAQDTVTQMLAASGMSQHSHRAFGSAAMPQAQQQAATPPTVAAPVLYGGVIPSATGNQYAVYVPNQQFGQPAAAPAVSITPTQATASQGIAAAPAAAGFDPRSPFNPQTSAISCPMGMRRHPGAAGLPLTSTPGADGSQRCRVFVAR